MLKRRTLRQRPAINGMRGAAMLEFAVVAPILLLLIMSGLGFTFRWGQVLLFEDALHATARAVSLSDESSLRLCRDQAQEHFKRRMDRLGLDFLDLDLSPPPGGAPGPDLILSATVMPRCANCFAFGTGAVKRVFPVYLEDPLACEP